jgi:hypothetical protein
MKRWLVVGMVMLWACGQDKNAPRVQDASSAELDALRDSVMPRLQVLAGLPQRGEIKMEVQTRDSLRRYIETRMAEELPPEELEGIRATYVTLGLLPADLDLQKLLLDLYTEQVVGYYDPTSKKLFVVQGVEREMLRPTLIHELVHALQDQHTNLDSLIARERGNDRQSAAQAAIEGHATMVMLAQASEESGQPLDPRMLPDFSTQIRLSMEEQNKQFPVFKEAPRIIRETLLFPYVAGAGFVKALWIRPLETGFGEPYPPPINERMPQSTEQVLRPDSRYLVTRDEPTELTLEGSTGPTARENTLGQLETSIWLTEHLDADAARFAEGWDGDRYRLLPPPTPGKGNILVWYSVWDSEGAAHAFAAAARRIAQKRGRASRVERLNIEGRPFVLILDGDAGTDLSAVQVPRVAINKPAG